MPVLLEPLCGTKSIGKVFDQHGYDVISVDMLDKLEPTICKDVLDLTPEYRYIYICIYIRQIT